MTTTTTVVVTTLMTTNRIVSIPLRTAANHEDKMDAFTSAYIECALWSSNDESTPDGGEFIDDDNYDEGDLDPQTRDAMVADCKRFQDENRDDIDTWVGDTTCDEQAGHDFWFNRNGHGVGFWEPEWDEEPGSRLDRASEAFGEFNLYVEGGTVFGE